MGDAAFRAQRDALESAQQALKKLAMQAHGEVLVQLLDAWKNRDASKVPSGQELGKQLNNQARTTWANAIANPPGAKADGVKHIIVALGNGGRSTNACGTHCCKTHVATSIVDQAQ